MGLGREGTCTCTGACAWMDSGATIDRTSRCSVPLSWAA
jgi:hypothetical protein